MPEARPVPRLRSLDGLRGFAALIVVVHHAVLAVPALATPYFADVDATTPGSPAWWLSYSPLHLLWAGGEAVVVFFVLSGLVLALKTQSPRFDWGGYFPERLARLYLPVAGAVAFGVALVLAVPRSGDHALGPWVALRPTSPTVSGTVDDLLLVFGPSRLITPLWSLQWEVVFSLLLPLYVVAAMALRRMPLMLAALCLGASAVGYAAGRDWLIYLPMFGVGVAMAALVSSSARPRRRSGVAWTAVAGLALLLVTSRWTLAPFLEPGAMTRTLTGTLVLVSAALLVAAAVYAPPLRWVLQTRWAQWLGRISFSLYLIHEPIVVTLAEVLGPGHGPFVLPLALLISLPVAALFFRLVERPSHRIAKRVGAWASGESMVVPAPAHRAAPTHDAASRRVS